jgi:hypothetical protein
MTKKTIQVLAVLTCAAVWTLVNPLPANAAVGTCNSVAYWTGSIFAATAEVPVRGTSPNCVLGSGNAGNPTRVLQRSLNRCYQQGLTVDGIYGPRTATAVRNVQRRHGIAVDGIYGPQTSRTMRFAWWSPYGDFITCARR